MKEFGWSIEYTLNLTYPVFLNLFSLIRQIRCDAAIDQVYTPYAAAKYGGKVSQHLFEGRGSFTLKNEASQTADVTPEMIERANNKLRKIIAEREKKLLKTVQQPIS